MRTNLKFVADRTYEGGPAVPVSPEAQLRRTVMTCMLWENGFYEDGQTVAQRIKALVPAIHPNTVAEIAIEAREKQKLRHVPLLLVRELARKPSRCESGLIAKTLCAVIQRADELAEFLALYWADGRVPLSKQIKRGLACAFEKFNAYQLAKYNREASVKLRDVMFMVHPKPRNEEQAEIWKKLVNGTLESPDTWEVALSAGGDKKAVFERLLAENKLGYMALLRNLRNMAEAGVSQSLVESRLIAGASGSKALPFRFLAAARAVPSWEPMIDKAMQMALVGSGRLTGKTAVLIDVSGSMAAKISERSDLSRLDAAKALAILVRGICDDVRVYRFNHEVREVPARHGMALADSIGKADGGTYIENAVSFVRGTHPDRMIVVTDEQSADAVGSPQCKGYMINVATNKNGVGYGDWVRISGWSESVVDFIRQVEAN